MASRIAEKKVFCGTFIHSTSKQDLEILHNAAVAVDEAGKIVAVSKGWESIKDAQQAVLAQAGWKQEDTTIVLAAKGQFFFPGFIGTSGFFARSACKIPLTNFLHLSRHTYPRLTVSQCRYLWQNNTVGLA